MQTVTEQLESALAKLVDIRENPLRYPLDIMVPAYAAAWAALDRARADPETLLREAGQARRELGERVRDGG